MNIDLSISTKEAAKCIEKATGHGRVKLTAPLSGWVKGNRFRVTLPPGGIHHPYQPVISGEISPTTSGCRVVITHVQPWLGHLAGITVLLVFLSLEWEDINSMVTGSIIFGAVILVCLSLRRSQQQELMRKINAAFCDKAI